MSDAYLDLERNNARKSKVTPTAVTTRLPPGRCGIVAKPPQNNSNHLNATQ